MCIQVRKQTNNCTVTVQYLTPRHEKLHWHVSYCVVDTQFGILFVFSLLFISACPIDVVMRHIMRPDYLTKRQILFLGNASTVLCQVGLQNESHFFVERDVGGKVALSYFFLTKTVLEMSRWREDYRCGCKRHYCHCLI